MLELNWVSGRQYDIGIGITNRDIALFSKKKAKSDGFLLVSGGTYSSKATSPFYFIIALRSLWGTNFLSGFRIATLRVFMAETANTYYC